MLRFQFTTHKPHILLLLNPLCLTALACFYIEKVCVSIESKDGMINSHQSLVFTKRIWLYFPIRSVLHKYPPPPKQKTKNNATFFLDYVYIFFSHFFIPFYFLIFFLLVGWPTSYIQAQCTKLHRWRGQFWILLVCCVLLHCFLIGGNSDATTYEYISSYFKKKIKI